VRLPVQQLRGAAPEGSWALFYALSGYTASAVQVADQARVALFRYDQDANGTTVNEVADFLLRSRQTDATARPEAFALEQKIKAVTQQSFDVAVSLFMSLANRGLEVAKVTGTFHPFVRAVLDELDRVHGITQGVHDRTVTVSEFLQAAEQIKDAAGRLITAMDGLPDSLRPN